jgi:hypothetical protein
LDWRSERNILLRRLSNNWKNNSKIYLREIWWAGVDWIQLNLARVITVINIRLQKIRRIYGRYLVSKNKYV